MYLQWMIQMMKFKPNNRKIIKNKDVKKTKS